MMLAAMTLRIFSQTISEENESGYACFYGSTEYTQLYSLNNDSWKNIPNVDAFLHRGNTVFIKDTMRCYWQACLGYSFSGRDNRMACISFDFALEEFGHLYLPPLSTSDCVYTLVSCNDALGVIICPRDLSSPSGPSSSILQIYKWLERKKRRDHGMEERCSALDFYDISVDKFKKTRISSDRGQMYVFPYEESMRRLTDASLNFDSSSSSEDGEYDEDEEDE